ncbi:MAG: FHA domain-containing protein, partial [Nocardioides sp.]
GGALGAWTGARALTRSKDAALLPDRSLAPPATLLPLAPTFLRRRRAPVTTTHDPRGGGDPRLVLAPRDDLWPGDPQPVYPLRGAVTTIGSDASCDIRLPGLAAVQAEIRHDADDEFVLVHVGGPGSPTRVHGEAVRQRILRTASRVDLGGWTLTYYREEYADHGRPYGGRVGGELGHQRPQPPRRRLPGDGAVPQGEVT